jgi:SnoaL-like protein
VAIVRRPKDVVNAWVEAFNGADAEALAALYAADATNHQVVREPVEGRAAIVASFTLWTDSFSFSAATGTNCPFAAGTACASYAVFAVIIALLERRPRAPLPAA